MEVFLLTSYRSRRKLKLKVKEVVACSDEEFQRVQSEVVIDFDGDSGESLKYRGIELLLDAKESDYTLSADGTQLHPNLSSLMLSSVLELPRPFQIRLQYGRLSWKTSSNDEDWQVDDIYPRELMYDADALCRWFALCAKHPRTVHPNQSYTASLARSLVQLLKPTLDLMYPEAPEELGLYRRLTEELCHSFDLTATDTDLAQQFLAQVKLVDQVVYLWQQSSVQELLQHRFLLVLPQIATGSPQKPEQSYYPPNLSTYMKNHAKQLKKILQEIYNLYYGMEVLNQKRQLEFVPRETLVEEHEILPMLMSQFGTTERRYLYLRILLVARSSANLYLLVRSVSGIEQVFAASKQIPLFQSQSELQKHGKNYSVLASGSLLWRLNPGKIFLEGELGLFDQKVDSIYAQSAFTELSLQDQVKSLLQSTDLPLLNLAVRKNREVKFRFEPLGFSSHEIISSEDGKSLLWLTTSETAPKMSELAVSRFSLLTDTIGLHQPPRPIYFPHLVAVDWPFKQPTDTRIWQQQVTEPISVFNGVPTQVIVKSDPQNRCSLIACLNSTGTLWFISLCHSTLKHSLISTVQNLNPTNAYLSKSRDLLSLWDGLYLRVWRLHFSTTTLPTNTTTTTTLAIPPTIAAAHDHDPQQPEQEQQTARASLTCILSLRKCCILWPSTPKGQRTHISRVAVTKRPYHKHLQADCVVTAEYQVHYLLDRPTVVEFAAVGRLML